MISSFLKDKELNNAASYHSGIQPNNECKNPTESKLQQLRRTISGLCVETIDFSGSILVTKAKNMTV